jgi:hypothetical protein
MTKISHRPEKGWLSVGLNYWRAIIPDKVRKNNQVDRTPTLALANQKALTNGHDHLANYWQ